MQMLYVKHHVCTGQSSMKGKMILTHAAQSKADETAYISVHFLCCNDRRKVQICTILGLYCANFGSQLCSCPLLSQSCFCGDGCALQCCLSPATLDLQGYRCSQQGGGSQARSFKDQITGLFRSGPTSENQQPSSDSSKPQSNFFLELPVKDHRSVMIAWWQCQ